MKNLNKYYVCLLLFLFSLFFYFVKLYLGKVYLFVILLLLIIVVIKIMRNEIFDRFFFENREILLKILYFFNRKILSIVLIGIGTFVLLYVLLSFFSLKSVIMFLVSNLDLIINIIWVL